jgi:RND family efflux transporter MFP subunit
VVFVAVPLLAALAAWFWFSGQSPTSVENKTAKQSSSPAPFAKEVHVAARQQQDLGIVTAEVSVGSVSAVFSAPGQVVPDESQFAYITPRAKGIIRDVHAQIGQFVKKDDLLVTIDSSEVAQARLQLIDALTRLEIARATLNWQETIYRNGLDMIESLRSDPDPDQIQVKFAERPVGKTREQLLTAYAQFHLSKIASQRYDKLSKQDAVPLARAQQQRAAYQVDRATFQGLMDRMAFEITLEYTQARQELRESRTAVKVARETLRVYGVPINQIAEQFEAGELTGKVGHGEPKATLRAAAEAALSPSRDVSELMKSEGEPVSTYELRAPFDGTVLERERIVPGVVVDGTYQLFTMAGLDTVWVEAHVHESDFDLLNRSKGGRVTFTSPAYPDDVFSGQVLYTGNLVDQKSRMVRMLATAKNPDHKLNPGMFVTVEIHSKDARKVPKVPSSALLTDNDAHFVFVRTGPERFERRQVEIGRKKGDEVAIARGLEPGERVVVKGAFGLKAKSEAKE